MSVLIKGMEMPRNCDDCHFDIDCAYDESQDGYKMMGGRPRKCPLVPVPKHGRLIDANALTETMDGIWDCNDLYFQPNDKICDPVDCKGCKWHETMDCCKRMVKHAPTIIPASEEGET